MRLSLSLILIDLIIFMTVRMMKLLVVAASILVAQASPVEKSIGHPRIVGGAEAEPHSFPWQISLQYRDLAFGIFYHTCGATIIDEYHLACASHCVVDRKASHFRVVAGAHNIDFPETSKQKIGVASIVHHESYNPSVITNDVSLITLEEPLVFNEFVQPMKLAEAGSDPEGGTMCVNSGWGSTSTTSFPSMPSKLQFVEMPIVDRSLCQSNYNGINGVDDGMVCAGLAGISSCSGDSGGPLVCPDANGELYLAGIVSWGMIPCGQAEYPTVFANVGHFRDWFDSHM